MTPMTPDELLAARKEMANSLRNLRISKNRSLTEMATKSGLARFTINTLENGESCFSINTFIIYRAALYATRKKKRKTKTA